VPVLAVLRHEEGIRLNPDPLVALYAELGENGAERVICRAVEELAARLSEMLRHADSGDGAALVRSARLAAKVADQVGMSTLARVAGDVVGATERHDLTAQAAILARLMRIGDRSLTAVWDLRGMTL
jgi:hypothetical protein